MTDRVVSNFSIDRVKINERFIVVLKVDVRVREEYVEEVESVVLGE